MVRRDSSSSDTLKLETLIRDYINNSKSNAEVELRNITNINGNTLLDVLNNLDLESEEKINEYKRSKYDYDEKVKEYTNLEENYKKLDENYKKLLDNLKLLLKNPFIQSIEDMVKIIKEASKE